MWHLLYWLTIINNTLLNHAYLFTCLINIVDHIALYFFFYNIITIVFRCIFIHNRKYWRRKRPKSLLWLLWVDTINEKSLYMLTIPYLTVTFPFQIDIIDLKDVSMNTTQYILFMCQCGPLCVFICFCVNIYNCICQCDCMQLCVSFWACVFEAVAIFLCVPVNICTSKMFNINLRSYTHLLTVQI